MNDYNNDGRDKLAVLWTSGDRQIALKMVFMYARNADKNHWWDVVRLIVWGPSAQLLAQDEELQVYVQEMLANGIEVAACKGCANAYDVSDKLEQLGIEVLFIGEEFTGMIKSDWKMITI